MKFRNGREILEITSIKFNHKKREKKKKTFPVKYVGKEAEKCIDVHK